MQVDLPEYGNDEQIESAVKQARFEMRQAEIMYKLAHAKLLAIQACCVHDMNHQRDPEQCTKCGYTPLRAGTIRSHTIYLG